MTAPTWSDEPPTTPGFFWWSRYGTDLYAVVVVEQDGELFRRLDDGRFVQLSDMVAGQWQPMPTPDELASLHEDRRTLHRIAMRTGANLETIVERIDGLMALVDHARSREAADPRTEDQPC